MSFILFIGHCVIFLVEGLLLSFRIKSTYYKDRWVPACLEGICCWLLVLLFFIVKKEWIILQFLDLLLSYLLLSVIDIRTHQIPNSFLIYIGISQLLYRVLANPIQGILREFLIGFIVYVFFLFVSILTKGSMGMGDAKLLGLTAVFTGIGYLMQIIFWGMLCAFVFSVFLLACKKGDKKTELPFVPFLMGGMIIHIVTWVM